MGYFLDLAHLQSQKQPPHRAMLSPLAHHCKGYLQPGSKNLLVGVECKIKTAWHKLDNFLKQCTPVLIRHQKISQPLARLVSMLTPEFLL